MASAPIKFEKANLPDDLRICGSLNERALVGRQSNKERCRHLRRT